MNIFSFRITQRDSHEPVLSMRFSNKNPYQNQHQYSNEFQHLQKKYVLMSPESSGYVCSINFNTHILYVVCTQAHIEYAVFDVRFSFFIKRLRKNIKWFDIDRKFYNRQCNPFDIAKPRKFLALTSRYIQFIKLVLCSMNTLFIWSKEEHGQTRKCKRLARVWTISEGMSRLLEREKFVWCNE